MFGDGILTVLVQAFLITVVGWITVFAWQEVGVTSFAKRIFRKRNMRNL